MSSFCCIHMAHLFLKLCREELEKLKNYTKYTENACMYSVNIPFRACGQCITQISCVGIFQDGWKDCFDVIRFNFHC